MKKIQLSAGIISLIVFIILTILTLNNKLIDIDYIIIDYIIKIRNVHLTTFLKIISFFGGTIFLISLTLVLLFLFKSSKTKLNLVQNLLFITLLNVFLKNIIRRNRPLKIALIFEDSYSFPSGHAMISSAFYLYLIFLINDQIKNKSIKIMLTIFLSLLILLICFSRIYLGVHFFSDVICGLLFAIGFTNLFTFLLKEKK